MNNINRSCAIIYSGGTDSTCVAVLAAEEFQVIHLLTFYEKNAKKALKSKRNIEILKKKFPNREFVHKMFSVKKLVRYFSYKSYLYYLVRYKFLNLSTCGFSSLSWHLRTIIYCKENNITKVMDGLTKELMHFPGHMDIVIEEFKKIYLEYGIEYTSPVRGWDTPKDQQFIDRLIVDQHGFCFPHEKRKQEIKKTTGQYLYNKGILPHPNVKGSSLDHSMQQDCYPFVLYNIMFFWVYMCFYPYDLISIKIRTLLDEKMKELLPMLNEYLEKKTGLMLKLL